MGFEFPPGHRPPWLNERGELLLQKLHLDSTLARAISGDKRECREAVRVLGFMQHSGRVEAGIYLMGLLAGAPDDWEWRTAIVEALHGFDIEGCARLLFGELRAVKGSNTTRRYRDAVLKNAGDAFGRTDVCRLRGDVGRPNLFAAHARQGPLHPGWCR